MNAPLGAIAPVPVPARSPSAGKARAALYGLLLWAPILANATITAWWGSEPALHSPWVGALRAILGLLPFTVLAVVLPSVGYRRRAAFFLLVPLWNISFTRTVCRRLAGLPD